MNLSEFTKLTSELSNEGEKRMLDAKTLHELLEIRHQYLGRERGVVAALSSSIASVPKEDRGAAGAWFQTARGALEHVFELRQTELKQKDASRSMASFDLTMPPRHQWRGAKHPVTLVIEEIEGIFRELGFTVAQGPEAETDWYNFYALNFPPNHPALDAHDTLYLSGDVVLRTHTSPVQVRTLQKYAPPIRVLIPGLCFRRDFFDASHAPAFEQIEGLCVDEGISFVDLKSTLSNFARRFFGAARTRFRPSFFPFTEPSAEMDVQCGVCGGVGCPVCKGTGWVEILGCGMVHPAVLEASGVDSERYTGWAFGMGPARVALTRYKIPDIRLLYDSDVRFLEQLADPGGR